MNSKTTYVLFACLVVIFGAFAAVLFYEPGAANLDNYVLPQFHTPKEPLKTDEIDRVEIQRDEPKEKTIVLVRDGKQWQITEPVQARADNSAVEGLIRELAEATRVEHGDKAPSLAAWGLQPPQAIITLKKGDKAIRVNIGKEGGVNGDTVYVQDPERPKDAMAVRKQQIADVFKKLPDYRDPVLIASLPDDIREVKISEGGKEVALEKQDNRWRYTIPADYGDAEVAGSFAPAGEAGRAPTSINTLLANLTNFRLEKAATDIIADDVSDADLASKYKLDDKSPVLHVQVKLAGQDKPVELLIAVGAKVDDRYYYAKVAGTKTVVRIKTADADSLRKLLDDRSALRNRALVTTESKIDALDIRNAAGLVRLRRQEGVRPPPMVPGHPQQFNTDTWTLWRDDTTPLPVEESVMSPQDSLLNLLRQKTPPVIESFIDLAPKDKQAEQEKELELTNPSAVVSIWAGEDGIVKDEPKEDKDEKKDDKKDDKKEEKKDDKAKTLPKLKSSEPSYRISFGKHFTEGGRELVVIKRETKRKDGDKTTYDVALGKVSVLLFDKARKGPLAYMSRELPGYNPTGPADKDVTKIAIQRGGQVTEVARAKEGEPWKIVKPDNLDGRLADPIKVRSLLGMLNGLPANELVAEKPDKKDLEQVYGLEPAATRIEITVTGTDKPFVVAFGKPGPKDGPNETLYAKLSWNDTVFTFAKLYVEQIPTDFLDTTVAKFDPADVKTLRLKGWKNVVGSPVVLSLERKDSTSWTVKEPSGYDLDDAKVKTLLDALSNLKAEKFVGTVEAKPETGLSIDEGGLKIEITFSKDEKPIEIFAGKLEGDNYYATSNTVLGQVFLVKKAVFDGPKSLPAYFGKAK